MAFVAIKMGRRPIFIATLRAVASWLFFLRRGGSTRMNQIWALRSRLEKPPTGRRRKPCYLWDSTLEFWDRLGESRASRRESFRITTDADNAMGLSGASPHQKCDGTFRKSKSTIPRDLPFAICYLLIAA
jgi:hypothetical protein